VARAVVGGIPWSMDLVDSWQLEFTALDPTTGAVVGGVVVADASLLVDSKAGGDLDTGFADIEPLFTPIPVTDG
jgi:hypothetical protein